MDIVKVGPVGNESKQKWDHKGLTEIAQIVVSYGSRHFSSGGINSLQIRYRQNGNLLHTPEVIGRPDLIGPMFKTLTFQPAGEYITKVKGTCVVGSTLTPGIVKLSIQTNVKVYEVCDDADGLLSRQRFSFEFGGSNEFGGFYGTCTDDGPTSIGVYFNRWL